MASETQTLARAVRELVSVGRLSEQTEDELNEILGLEVDEKTGLVKAKETDKPRSTSSSKVT